jgi:hypothetical protein
VAATMIRATGFCPAGDARLAPLGDPD